MAISEDERKLAHRENWEVFSEQAASLAAKARRSSAAGRFAQAREAFLDAALAEEKAFLAHRGYPLSESTKMAFLVAAYSLNGGDFARVVEYTTEVLNPVRRGSSSQKMLTRAAGMLATAQEALPKTA